jgi:hypothetical protein
VHGKCGIEMGHAVRRERFPYAEPQFTMFSEPSLCFILGRNNVGFRLLAPPPHRMLSAAMAMRYLSLSLSLSLSIYIYIYHFQHHFHISSSFSFFKTEAQNFRASLSYRVKVTICARFRLYRSIRLYRWDVSTLICILCWVYVGFKYIN